MPNYKQLCAELLSALENEGYANWVKGPDEDELCLRARAALAEPEPQMPTEIEIASILKAYAVVEPQIGVSRILHEKHFSNAARALLARLGRPASTPQPADGEVAELVAWMRNQATVHEVAQTQWAKRFVRAASLLERLSPPQPVPVSERLPKAEDCDAEGRCWLFRLGRDGVGDWLLRTPYPSADAYRFFCVTHWLPAIALPVPSHD